jgi:nucleolin
MRNLPWSVQDDDVHTFFKECGAVTGIKWIENKETGRFTGSGIIDFESAEAAAAAVAKNGADFGGRPVGIEFSRSAGGQQGGRGGFQQGGRDGNRNDRGNFKRAEASSSFDKKNARAPTPKPVGCRTIFVGNLSFNVDDGKITDFFGGCGEVKEIRWVEKDGQFKGCGFIEFVDSDSTDKAVAQNGTNFMGRPIRIDFAAGKGQ